MRIAQVCPYSLSVPGGVQGQVLGLARALRRLGHEARVLAPCDGPPPDSMVTPLGKSVPTASNGSMAPIAPDPACALRTINVLRNEDFDVLHLHEPIVPGPTATALFVADSPVLGTFHAAGHTLAYDYLPRLARRMARKIRISVAVSDDALAAVQPILGGKYEILFNGIDIDEFASAVPWQKDEKTIFFIGRHEQRKGLSVLIDAMSSLPSDVRLWIAGTGPQTNELKAKTKGDKRIEWLGRVSDAEKAQRLRAADVFCAPSISGESFGIVLLEAMAAGCPVVATDIAGYRNVVRDTNDAVLFSPGDAGELASAITKVFEDSSLAERLKTSGAERAEMFSMEHLAKAYLALYERII